MSTPETTKKPLPAWLKLVLELGPVIGFVAGYAMIKDDTFLIGGTEYEGFIVATAAFVPVLLASMGLLWWLTGKLSRMQVFTAVLVIVFGGLTVWLNDDRFIKIKTTLVYGLMGGLLGIGLLRGQSWLQYVMEGLMPLTDEGWMLLTKRLCAFFLGMALFNEIVWRTMSTEMWVYIESFGMPLALFAFFMLQGKLFEAHAIEETADDEDQASDA